MPSATPEGEDEDIRWEKWLSVFRHVQNIHVGHGDHFPRCEHGELDDDDRRKRWLRPGKNRSSFNLDVYKYYIFVLFSITFIIIHIYLLVDLVFNLFFFSLGSKVVEKLEGIIHSRQMKKDIRMLSLQLQTANLEAYHSLINHFAPKMNKFSYQGMQSR